ncbi:MAG TPA: branched-chain amino acid ABC transporter substrate-binding protein [Collimonas sp.]|nr:branched-chain amino acid ABC transporter substrate-binding protein [Collimonas sp.]HWX01718.1 branched-chain amino acid ABC transporter substrate-binding protein [Collimonas sp.]
MVHTTKMMPLAAAIALSLAASAQAQEQVVKIAHVGPITGPIAHIGKDNENGARMAIEALNAQGIVLDGKKTRFVLVAEDDASDPKQATAVAQKLVDAKVAGVIGHVNSGTSIPASKIYYDAGIPQISPSTTSAKYTQQGFNTTFRVVANDSQLGGALGRYAASTLHAKTAAVIDDRTAYGQGLAEEFSKAAKAAGMTIVSSQFTNDKATDFNAILTSFKAKKPDVVFFGGLDAGAGPMLRQMRALGIKAKFMGGDAICTSDLPKLAGDGISNDQVICAEAGGVEDSGRKALDGFRTAYKIKYGKDVVIYAPYTYDALMTMADAMQKAKSADPKKYLPELAKIQHQGVTGMISFDAKGDIKDGTITLYTYRGAQRSQLAVTK